MSFDLDLDFATSQQDHSQHEANDDSGFIDTDVLDDKLQMQALQSHLAAAPSMSIHGL